MKNKIIKIVVIVLIAISVGFNVYALCWKKIENNIMKKGANQVLGAIMNQIDQTGQVKINNTVLVPQVQFQIEQPQLQVEK